jgi:hypothetical protein
MNRLHSRMNDLDVRASLVEMQFKACIYFHILILCETLSLKLVMKIHKRVDLLTQITSFLLH